MCNMLKCQRKLLFGVLEHCYALVSYSHRGDNDEMMDPRCIKLNKASHDVGGQNTNTASARHIESFHWLSRRESRYKSNVRL